MKYFSNNILCHKYEINLFLFNQNIPFIFIIVILSNIKVRTIKYYMQTFNIYNIRGKKI